MVMMKNVNSLLKSIIAVNKGAKYHYDIFGKVKAGIELRGHEVKGLREKRVNIADGFVKIVNSEAFLCNVHIGLPSNAKVPSYNPLRIRRLLLRKSEIKKIDEELQKKGITVVPLQIFEEGNLFKVLIAIAKGKKKYDKRRQIIERETKREIQRYLKYKEKE